ncbi:CPBP family intramembrane glutamic endopeptidase [Peptostreptococcus faecalis]|uniref:CPBP family intramembrane glutamic endopeptidase n=1 Tax=Peptostreptococcus faecalis TaxID=2045015 RepID=UPI000C7E4BEE|nr:type II CAAX endopeptidase family protein [Peptostreptococcus faecalis]
MSEEIKKSKSGISIVLKEFSLILLMIVLWMIPSVLEGFFGYDSSESIENMKQIPIVGQNAIILTIVTLLIVGVFILIAKKVKIGNFDFSFFTKKNIILILVVFVLGYGVSNLGLYALKLQGVETTANEMLLNESFKMNSKYLSFVSIVVAAPIIEEIIFRGEIIGRAFRAIPFVGIVVSASLFGIAHGPTDIISFAMYAALGLFWAIAYYKTQRIEVSISIHLLNNLVAFIGMLFI